MIHPSYTDLMNVVNDKNQEEKVVKSRYSIVLAVAKRARQIITLDNLENTSTAKPLSQAVEELYKSDITILGDE